MTGARYLVGDVFDRMAELPDASIDLVMTSPPFLALRSYLPADHPDKAKEIGSESTPAEFLDTLLRLTAEWGRLLAPHGSICVELGDTYAGSGGAGGDYDTYGMRDGQPRFTGSAARTHPNGQRHPSGNGAGWPQDKSLCFIPSLYGASLAYGRNLLRAPMTAREMLDYAEGWTLDNPDSSAIELLQMLRYWFDRYAVGNRGPVIEYEQWRVRNKVAWVRPNPPVGALGDKFRPATSYLTIATRARDRYFDLDAVRTPAADRYHERTVNTKAPGHRLPGSGDRGGSNFGCDPAGAPPLDWWNIPPRGTKAAHYAVYPPELCVRPIAAMTPRKVCTTCGKPSRRITGDTSYQRTDTDRVPARLAMTEGQRIAERVNQHHQSNGANTSVTAQRETVGWSDCGHGTWRPGHVLDPFAGTGTTLQVATGHGHQATGIDIDPANAVLAQERLGMFLTIHHPEAVA